MFLMSFEKMMNKQASITRILSVSKQIIEAQKGDIYNGEFSVEIMCWQR